MSGFPRLLLRCAIFFFGLCAFSQGALAQCVFVGPDNFNCSGNVGVITLIGSVGNDNFNIADGTTGQITIISGGAATRDRVDFSAVTATVTIDALDQAGYQFVAPGLQIWLQGFASIHLVGGQAADFLAGTDSDDVIDGGPGDDILSGNDGADLINGGGGVDRIFGGIGDDTLNGDGDDDLINGGPGVDTIDGGAGTDSRTDILGPDCIPDVIASIEVDACAAPAPGAATSVPTLGPLNLLLLVLLMGGAGWHYARRS